jgi:hypothetical protein
VIRYFISYLCPILASFSGPSWAIAAMLCSNSALATTFVPRPLPDQVQETATIVRGQIGAHTSDWVVSDDHSRRIFTIYQLQVKEVFKGDTGANGTIRIRELGGEKDGVGMQVSGAAQFAQGEDVVVFLGPENSDGSYDVLGLESGRYSIQVRDGQECLAGMNSSQQCEWNVNSLRKVVADQGQGIPGKKALPASPKPSPSVGSFSDHALSPSSNQSTAPRLQPGGWLWLGVLGFGLVLLAVIYLKN